jgi:hypothetical protein
MPASSERRISVARNTAIMAASRRRWNGRPAAPLADGGRRGKPNGPVAARGWLAGASEALRAGAAARLPRREISATDQTLTPAVGFSLM